MLTRDSKQLIKSTGFGFAGALSEAVCAEGAISMLKSRGSAAAAWDRLFLKT
jgi:hypothetical protein